MAEENQKTNPFLDLLGLTRRRKGTLLAAVIAAAVAAILVFVPAYAVRGVLVRASEGEISVSALAPFMALIIGLFLLRWVLLLGSLILSHIVAYDALYDLRISITRKLGRVPLGAVTSRTSGSVNKILQEDVESIELFIGHILLDTVAAIVAPAVAAIILFALDWRLGVAGIVALPLAFWAQTAMFKQSAELVTGIHHSHERMNGALVQFVQGIAVIKSFGLTGSSFRQLKTAVTDYSRLVEAISKSAIPNWALFQTTVKASALFLAPVGGWLVVSGELSSADYIFTLLIGVSIGPPLMRVLFAMNNVRIISEGKARVDAILNMPEQALAAHSATPKNGSIQFENVSFTYGSEWALEDFNLRVAAGEKVALVGRSGSGKSTVAHLLARMWDVDDGCIKAGGVDIRELAPEALNRTVAFVFQDVFLFNDTVAENLKIARPDASREDLEAASKLARAHDFIAALPDGYDTQIGERGARLSGGERQRLSIARAILRDAPVIVLDEATAFADEINAAAIARGLDALMSGRTVISIAHRLSSIKNADKIVVLDAGRLVAEGDHDTLLTTSDLYRNLWRAYEAASGWRSGAMEDSHAAEVD